MRRASTEDLETLVAHRRAMFQDMGYNDETALDAMSAKSRAWLLKHMQAGDYHAWLVCAPDGSSAAGAGLWVMDWLPHMIGKGSQRGNIVNVYSSASYRRRGLARHIMEAILLWCGQNGVDIVVLHASDSGRKLYELMGFTPTNEMRLRL